MNASIGKYAPKTKTYGMTILLANRVMLCAGISNIRAENYWNAVYSSLKVDMDIKSVTTRNIIDH